jgi:transposase
MMNDAPALPKMTIGLDVGDRFSVACEIDARGTQLQTAKIGTTIEQMTRYFVRERCRVVLEVGSHSPWLARLLEELGHEVFVANPSAMYGSRRRRKRNDCLDAEFLARQGRADPTLLHPIVHRHARGQEHLALLEISWCGRVLVLSIMCVAL